MLRLNFTLAFLVAVGLLAAVAAEEPKAAQAKTANAALERLKTLVGDWQKVDSKDGAGKNAIAFRYRLTAGGSAVAETILPDSNMEMLSVYHTDGDQLVMTHYCCAGNQPRMRARLDRDKDELVFEFTGGSNLNPAKDWHIHNGRIRFIDADHLHSEWEFYVDGKSAGKHSFDLVRKK